MFVDIHSHKLPVGDGRTVYSLHETQAEAVLQSDVRVWLSLGLHPWRPDELLPGHVEALKRWAADPRVVAIGECGLDKNAAVSLPQQVTVFAAQAALAEELGKPLIIHCVGCFNELFALKKQWKPRRPWIIHGFRGKPQLAGQALRAGCRLSFGERFNEASVRVTPLDSLYVETDESLLPIETIYERVAQARACRPDELTAGAELLASLTYSKGRVSVS